MKVNSFIVKPLQVKTEHNQKIYQATSVRMENIVLQ